MCCHFYLPNLGKFNINFAQKISKSGQIFDRRYIYGSHFGSNLVKVWAVSFHFPSGTSLPNKKVSIPPPSRDIIYNVHARQIISVWNFNISLSISKAWISKYKTNCDCLITTDGLVSRRLITLRYKTSVHYRMRICRHVTMNFRFCQLKYPAII